MDSGGDSRPEIPRRRFRREKSRAYVELWLLLKHASSYLDFIFSLFIK